MSFRRFTISSGVITMGLTTMVVAVATLPVSAQSLGSLTAKPAAAAANILGEIRNSTGGAQMGAAVLLYDRYNTLVRRGVSAEDGRFAFAGLAPDIYTLRVTLASFLPAMKRNILVLAGTDNLLRISLATLLSTIDVVPGASNRATLMNDDWKWVLRSSQSTRPVLRLIAPPTAKEATLFSDTTGVVRLSAGDSNMLNSGLQQDMATGFAVETSVSGDTKVRVSGSFGYGSSSGLPSAGIRTTYMHERNGMAGPQIALTVRQAYFPAAFGSGSGTNTPLLRTASLSTIDSMDLLDGLHLDYGFSMDSVMLFGRLNYFSPFARATYNLGGTGGLIKAAYSSGFTPVELLARQPEGQTDLTQDLTALGQAPRISRRDDHAAVERNKTYEVGYEVVDGDRTFAASMYREEVANAVFLVSGATELAGASNLLPDINTRGLVFNAGTYQRMGASAAVTQTVTDHFEIVVSGGTAGALVAAAGDPAQKLDPLRSQIQSAQRYWATVRADASMPVTGTHLAASYGWTDFNALMPTHLSLTGRTTQQLGWNFSCRQPLPGFGGTRMELSAELRNMLAQGYLLLSDGPRHAQLTNSPRALRGGLSFNF